MPVSDRSLAVGFQVEGCIATNPGLLAGRRNSQRSRPGGQDVFS